MDNYFLNCPPMMDDGRLFTDYRSSQVREEIFRYKNCLPNENATRTFRIETADKLMDEEWKYLKETKSCFPRTQCFHKHPTTRVTTNYNNAELLAYNGDLTAPKCEVNESDYRITVTKGSKQSNQVKKADPYTGYPASRCPAKCAKTNRLQPDYLYVIDNKY